MAHDLTCTTPGRGSARGTARAPVIRTAGRLVDRCRAGQLCADPAGGLVLQPAGTPGYLAGWVVRQPAAGELDGLGAGAPPRMIVGCRAGGGPGGSATGVGGPSDRSAYECRTGCPRPFGRRVRAGCADRRGAAGAVGAGT